MKRRQQEKRERELASIGDILADTLDPIERMRQRLERGDFPPSASQTSASEAHNRPQPSERPVATRSSTAPRPTSPPERSPATSVSAAEKPSGESPSGRYDFDLAEFPVFRFEKPKRSAVISPGEALVYEDKIRGKEGEEVRRTWKALAGPYGWGGETTQDLLYDLLQLYIAQGCRGEHIEFGSLRSLFRRRYGTKREPSAKDFTRLRRDLEILCGYRFETKNAFWDKERSRYVDMNWRLFDNVFYFKERPEENVFEFAFVEVNSVLQAVAKTRGFFAIGFASKVFYDLKPLEKRLAVYLAKRFLVEGVHRRFVDDLCRALPIEAKRPDNQRARLRMIAQGLIAKQVPILKSWRIEKSKATGRWLATFERARVPDQASPLPFEAAQRFSNEVLAQLDRLYSVLPPGAQENERWWSRCIERLGPAAVDRALGQLKDAPNVREPEKLLTKIFKDLARERGLSLN